MTVTASGVDPNYLKQNDLNKIFKTCSKLSSKHQQKNHQKCQTTRGQKNNRSRTIENCCIFTNHIHNIPPRTTIHFPHPQEKKTDPKTQSIVHLPTFAILRLHPRKLTWNPKHWWFGSMFLLFQEITFQIPAGRIPWKPTIFIFRELQVMNSIYFQGLQKPS